MGDSVKQARGMVLLAALFFATGGALIKGCEFTSLQIAGLRSAVAAVFLFALRKDGRHLRSPLVWMVGVAFAATMILYVSANKLTYAANAIYLQAGAPLFVFFLGPWVLKEAWSRIGAVQVGLIVIGITILLLGSGEGGASAPDPKLGNQLALLSGVGWAIVVIGIRALERRGIPSLSGVVAGNAVTAVAALPFALPVVTHDAWSWTSIGLLGIFQIGCAYLALTKGLKLVPALEAALLLSIEPVLNPLLAWAVHGETPSLGTWVGGGVILFASLLPLLVRRPQS